MNDTTTKQDFTTVDMMVPEAIISEEGVDLARRCGWVVSLTIVKLSKVELQSLQFTITSR